jgi:hypothetical protein
MSNAQCGNLAAAAEVISAQHLCSRLLWQRTMALISIRKDCAMGQRQQQADLKSTVSSCCYSTLQTRRPYPCYVDTMPTRQLLIM